MHLLVCGTETYLGPTRCQALHKGGGWILRPIPGWERSVPSAVGTLVRLGAWKRSGGIFRKSDLRQ